MSLCHVDLSRIGAGHTVLGDNNHLLMEISLEMDGLSTTHFLICVSMFVFDPAVSLICRISRKHTRYLNMFKFAFGQCAMGNAIHSLLQITLYVSVPVSVYLSLPLSFTFLFFSISLLICISLYLYSSLYLSVFPLCVSHSRHCYWIKFSSSKWIVSVIIPGLIPHPWSSLVLGGSVTCCWVI